MEQTTTAAWPAGWPVVPARVARIEPTAMQQLSSMLGILEAGVQSHQWLASLVAQLEHARAPIDGLSQLRSTLQQILYSRNAAMGALRRILAGDLNPALVEVATRQIQMAQRLQAEARPLVERMARTAPATYRPWVEAVERLATQGEAMISHAAQVARAAERLALPTVEVSPEPAQLGQ